MRRRHDGSWSADRHQHKEDIGLAVEAQAADWEALAEASDEWREKGRLCLLARKCRSGHYNKAILYTAKLILSDRDGTFGTITAGDERNG